MAVDEILVVSAVSALRDGLAWVETVLQSGERQREIHVRKLIINVLCNFEHLLVEYQYMNVHVATYMYMWKVALHLRYMYQLKRFCASPVSSQTL